MLEWSENCANATSWSATSAQPCRVGPIFPEGCTAIDPLGNGGDHSFRDEGQVGINLLDTVTKSGV